MLTLMTITRETVSFKQGKIDRIDQFYPLKNIVDFNSESIDIWTWQPGNCLFTEVK